MTQLRPYQGRNVDAVFTEWQEVRSVCNVLPTGAGKTVLAEAIIQRAQLRTLFLVHRVELVRQTAERFRSAFGDVDVIDPHSAPRGLPVTVASIQTLIARDLRPDADLVICDECHHFPSDEFKRVVDHYSSARVLGLTATPERSDGRPLGDVFERLVVGARYSELIADKYLLPCRVFRPPPDAMGDQTALAQDPLAAYQKHAPGSLCILFSPSVKLAYEQAERFTEAGIPAACIEANTKRGMRLDMLDRFKAGDLRVLTNNNVLTEGIDVPQVETVILAKAYRHVSAFLQSVGRVLRPHASMATAICIDLTGATHHHGLPTEDRLYSLDGEAIKRSSNTPLHVCMSCGATFPTLLRICPCCGDERPCKTPKPPRIYSIELQEVWAGEDTPSEAKDRELNRLLKLAQLKSYTLSWVSQTYEKTFGERPVLGNVDPDEKRREAERLVQRCGEKGWSYAYAAKQFKQAFGEDPDLSWLAEDLKLAELKRLSDHSRSKGYKPGWAAVQYKNLFGKWPRRGAA